MFPWTLVGSRTECSDVYSCRFWWWDLLKELGLEVFLELEAFLKHQFVLCAKTSEVGFTVFKIKVWVYGSTKRSVEMVCGHVRSWSIAKRQLRSLLLTGRLCWFNYCTLLVDLQIVNFGGFLCALCLKLGNFCIHVNCKSVFQFCSFFP